MNEAQLTKIHKDLAALMLAESCKTVQDSLRIIENYVKYNCTSLLDTRNVYKVEMRGGRVKSCEICTTTPTELCNSNWMDSEIRALTRYDTYFALFNQEKEYPFERLVFFQMNTDDATTCKEYWKRIQKMCICGKHSELLEENNDGILGISPSKTSEGQIQEFRFILNPQFLDTLLGITPEKDCAESLTERIMAIMVEVRAQTFQNLHDRLGPTVPYGVLREALFELLAKNRIRFYGSRYHLVVEEPISVTPPSKSPPIKVKNLLNVPLTIEEIKGRFTAEGLDVENEISNFIKYNGLEKSQQPKQIEMICITLRDTNTNRVVAKLNYPRGTMLKVEEFNRMVPRSPGMKLTGWNPSISVAETDIVLETVWKLDSEPRGIVSDYDTFGNIKQSSENIRTPAELCLNRYSGKLVSIYRIWEENRSVSEALGLSGATALKNYLLTKMNKDISMRFFGEYVGFNGATIESEIAAIIYDCCPISPESLKQQLFVRCGKIKQDNLGYYISKFDHLVQNGLYYPIELTLTDDQCKQILMALRQKVNTEINLKMVMIDILGVENTKLYYTSRNLEKLGLKCESKCVFPREFYSLTEALNRAVNTQDFLDFGETEMPRTLESKIDSQMRAGKLFVYNGSKYITLNKLQKMNITPDTIDDYWVSVRDFIGKNRLFTLKYLNDRGYSYPLLDFMPEDFKLDVLLSKPGIDMFSAGNNPVMCFSALKHKTFDLVKQCFNDEEVKWMDMDDLVDLLEREYGVTVTTSNLAMQVTNGGFYYHKGANMVFENQDLVLEYLKNNR